MTEQRKADLERRTIRKQADDYKRLRAVALYVGDGLAISAIAERLGIGGRKTRRLLEQSGVVAR